MQTSASARRSSRSTTGAAGSPATSDITAKASRTSVNDGAERNRRRRAASARASHRSSSRSGGAAIRPRPSRDPVGRAATTTSSPRSSSISVSVSQRCRIGAGIEIWPPRVTCAMRLRMRKMLPHEVSGRCHGTLGGATANPFGDEVVHAFGDLVRSAISHAERSQRTGSRHTLGSMPTNRRRNAVTETLPEREPEQFREQRGSGGASTARTSLDFRSEWLVAPGSL